MAREVVRAEGFVDRDEHDEPHHFVVEAIQVTRRQGQAGVKAVIVFEHPRKRRGHEAVMGQKVTALAAYVVEVSFQFLAIHHRFLGVSDSGCGKLSPRL